MKYTPLPISFISTFLCLWVCGVSFAADSPWVSEVPLPAPRRLPTGTPVPPPPVQPSVDTAGQAALPLIEEPAPAPRETTGTVDLAPGLSREEPAPPPREQTPSPPPLLLPSISRADPLADVQRLHQQIDSLRLEREAMLLEEIDLITAKEIKAGKGDETRQLRQRLTALLAKAVQQCKKQTTDEPPAGRQAANVKQPSKQTLPDAGGSAKPEKPRTTPSAPTAPSSPPGPSNPPTPIAQPDNSAKILTEAPVDPLSLAQSLFLSGDHAAALNAYRKLEQEEQKAEERIVIQYMIACCLRKLGKLNEAAVLFREVANSRGSDILVENAQWYLRAMKDRRELQTQLDELRQRRQSLLPRKP